MNSFYDTLDRLYTAGNVDAVEEFITGAINEMPPDNPDRIGLYNELAGFYRGVSRFAESMDAFEETLKLLEAHGLGGSVQYATVLLNYAGLHRLTGKPDTAIEFYVKSLKILEDSGDGAHYAYVSALNNLALAYQEKGEHETALKFAGTALEAVRSTSAGEHEIATSLNNLAAINLSLENLDTARENIDEALAIFDAMAEPDVHLAAALTTSGVISSRTGDYRAALEAFRGSLELTKRFFGENIEFAMCRRNTADVYERLGDIPSALTELADAERVFAKLLGDGHNAVAAVRAHITRLEGLAT